MKRALTALTICLTLGLLSAAAIAADDCCPPDGAAAASPAAGPFVQVAADQPQLPEGHPPMPAGDKLPKGHPPMPAAGQQMPAGHPPMEGNGQLPEGHANMGAIGTLVVKVTNGTPEAAVPAGAAVAVTFYRNGRAYHNLNTKLDDKGVVMIENIAIQDVIQPVVEVTHAGVAYRQIAHPMAAARPDQVMKMTVYESTDEQPQWTAKMRHVFIRVGPHGLEVTDVLVIDNPADRAWTGKTAEEGDKPVTLTLPIAADAQFVQFGPKTDAAKMEIAKGQVISHAPLLPGINEIAVGYVLEPKDGKVDVPLNAACDVKHMMLFVPDDASKVTVTGMGEGKAMAGRGEPAKAFQATDLKQDAKISVQIEGIEPPKAEQEEHLGAMAEPTDAPGRSNTPQLVAGLGGGGLILAAAGMMVYRALHKNESTTPNA